MMKRILSYIFLIMLAACSKHKHDVPDNAGASMKVYAMTKAAEPSDSTVVFLFWYATDFSSIGSVEPYFVGMPDKGIDNYNPNKQTYNTLTAYPKVDGSYVDVYATGYSPASLETSDGWSTLTVPEDKLGKLDILSSSGHITGNGASEQQYFDYFDPDTKTTDPLYFDHMLPRVDFKARMHEDMGTGRYLRNITITLDGIETASGSNGLAKDENIFTSRLVWDAVESRYIPDDGSRRSATVILKDPDMNQLDPSEPDPRDIGSVYIHPGLFKSISFRVEAEVADNPLFSDSSTMTLNVRNESFTKTGSNTVIDNPLGYNENYVITLIFNYDSVILEGRKAEWEEGENLVIPVYPDKTAE